MLFLPAVGWQGGPGLQPPACWDRILGSWVQSALVWGSLYPDALCGSCRSGLGCGQCAWFAPQGVLTKLDRTCEYEIPHKLCSYIFSWTVSLLGHTGLCACLASSAGGCRAAATQDRWVPTFCCGPISLCRLFLDKIFFCAHTFITRVKIKDRGPLVSRKMGEHFFVGIKVIPARLGVQPSASGPASRAFPAPAWRACPWSLLSRHLPGHCPPPWG